MTLRALFALTFAAAVAPALAQETPPVTVALDWTPNTNHVGLYVAQQESYYADAGLTVDILPYSDTSAETLVRNGVAQFGVTGTLGVYVQRAAGADLKAVYAVVQKETGRLVYPAERTAIETPADLDGLTYGGFGTAWEDTLVATMIENAGGDGTFETVTLGTSAYQALENGAVDFTMDVSTWEGVQAELEGVAQEAFLFTDYGVPDEHTTLIAASAEWLDANPERARAFVQATQRGYAFAAEHPDEAATILLDANATALPNPELVHASMQMLADENFLASPDRAVGAFDPAKVEAMGRFMFAAGLLRDNAGTPLKTAPDFSAAYTNQYLAP